MARIGNFAREVDLLISRTISPEARQKIAAKEARRILSEAQAANERVLGAVPPHREFVDGRENAPLESVNPDHGKIVFEFSLVGEMLEWIGEMLVEHSPIGEPPKDKHPGLYARSHVLLADGVEVDDGQKVPRAERYVFVSVLPYARKIEKGQSDDAPDGVYEVIADMAKRRFGNIAAIKFTYVTPTGGATELERWAEGKVSGVHWTPGRKFKTRRQLTAQDRREREKARQMRQPAISIVPR